MKSMTSTPHNRPARFAELLRNKPEELLAAWKARVLADNMVPNANRLSEPELRDTIPSLIMEIARAGAAGLPHHCSEARGRDIGANEDARQHASERIAEGYHLTEAIRELAIFRTTIIEFLHENGCTLDRSSALLIHSAIDERTRVVADAIEAAAHAQIRASEESLQEEAMFRERFIGILAHDLRSPLTAIKASAALLLKQGGLADDKLEITRRIARGSDRMARMIADVLDLARQRHGGEVPLNRQPMDLHEVCREAIAEMAAIYPEREITLNTVGHGRGEWDSDRLRQLLSNLLSNAVTYSPRGSPVRVSIRDEAAWIALEVNNEGRPIPAEDQAVLFEAFLRPRHPEEAGAPSSGLGLGLFIVKEIVRAHGGRIGVTSAEGVGTTFTVELPRAAP